MSPYMSGDEGRVNLIILFDMEGIFFSLENVWLRNFKYYVSVFIENPKSKEKIEGEKGGCKFGLFLDLIFDILNRKRMTKTMRRF